MARRTTTAVVLALLALAAAACGDDEHPASPPSLPGARIDVERPPELPRQGVAIWRRAGVVLVRLDGTVVGHLRGFKPLHDRRWPPRTIVLRDRDGTQYTIDDVGLHRASVPRRTFQGYGCHEDDARFVVCFPNPQRGRSTIRRDGRVVYGGASKIGHWVSARLSPDGATLLLQWSAECEVPVAYFGDVEGRRLRPVVKSSAESVALGWSADGRAVIAFPNGPCGGGSPNGRGVYLVDPTTRHHELVVRGLGAMWG